MTLPKMFGIGIGAWSLMSPQINLDPDGFAVVTPRKNVNTHCYQNGPCSNPINSQGRGQELLARWMFVKRLQGYPRTSSNQNIPNDATHGAAYVFLCLFMGLPPHGLTSKHLKTTWILPFGCVSQCGLPVIMDRMHCEGHHAATWLMTSTPLKHSQWAPQSSNIVRHILSYCS